MFSAGQGIWELKRLEDRRGKEMKKRKREKFAIKWDSHIGRSHTRIAGRRTITTRPIVASRDCRWGGEERKGRKGERERERHVYGE